MIKINWWLVDVLSRLLEPDERDAVRGDFQETGEPGGRALRDVLGLVVRRQAALWRDWGPWLGLAGLVAPLGMLLSLLARWFAESSAIYGWLYVNNWTWSFLTIPGARKDLLHFSAGFFLDFVTLMSWSWTTGFVLGALSRRAIWVNGTLFSLIVFGEFLLVPQPHNPFNAPVFALSFYTVVFPLVLRALLLVVPAVLGMYKGVRPTTLPLLHTILWTVAVALMTAQASRAIQQAAILSWWHVEGRIYGAGFLFQPSLQLRLLPLAVMWPVGYMAASAIWQYSRGKTSLA